MQHTPLRFYLMGQESLLIHCAEKIIDGGHTICGVICTAPRLVEWAESHDLPVIAPGKGLAERVTEPFDYFFSITNLSIVPSEVVKRADRGAINFHDGPLPRYAGLYVTAWALMHQEPSHGITWHAMTDEVDAGAIFEQRLFEVRDGETSFTLNTRCYEEAIDSFEHLLGQLASGTASPQPQPAHEPHYFGRDKRPRAVGLLDWKRPARELEALVRALDFGPVENPLALAKMAVGTRFVMVDKAEARDAATPAAPGTITARDGGLVVATGDGELVLHALRCEEGVVIDDLAARDGLDVGTVLPALADERALRLTAVHERVGRHEDFFERRLESLAVAELSFADRSAGAAHEHAKVALELPAGKLSGAELVAALTAFVARVGNAETLQLGYRDPDLAALVAGAEDLFATHVPLRVELDGELDFAKHRQRTQAEIERLHKRGTFARDLLLRRPAFQGRGAAIQADLCRLVIELVDDVDGYRAPPAAELALVVAADGKKIVCHHDVKVVSAASAAILERQWATFAAGLALDGARPIMRQPILSEAERHKLVVTFNQTTRDYPRAQTIHRLFEERVALTPDAPAIAFLDRELSYRELNERANALAHHLRGMGVGPDVLVGVCVERSADMMVATLGVMKAGGGYVPMDPDYPAERLALMLEDSGVPVLITQQKLLAGLPANEAKRVCIDDDWSTIGSGPKTNLDGGASASNIAYTIYTSGSTGRPKGVMVEHRNVVNFFVGMDERLGHTANSAPGVWLAVTSLSFDISVLELFWTLTRGFKVVLHSDKADDAALQRSQLKHADRPITFSLMYFASDEGENATSADKYKLLIEGAKFGDRHGFAAVWTPERHFHPFGGLYPNPSVASAAIATITERIDIRAASVVMPLHNPIRVAEEWALVDNLSQGRVGISFASGWQPNDFIIYKPERFATRKDAMLEDLDTVRRLWRGETYKATSPLGKEIEVTTFPRPVQKELPFWLTAAGNPETFRAAGEVGANLLTHLLGQSIEELREKIAVYREAWTKAGHAGRGSVTVMLHTFVGDDEAMVKETVREPMKAYLQSSLHLIKLAAYTFPTFKQKADATGKTPAEIFDEEELSPEDMDVLLEHSFERYYKTSGLFGTPATCMQIVDDLKGTDVDDVGCLLDYGVPSPLVLKHLEFLDRVRQLANAAPQAASGHTLAEQIERHQVTHMQCTPSQLTLILATEASAQALSKVPNLFVGGEAFPAALAREAKKVTGSTIINMYGPTETTIWSSTQTIVGDESTVAIGTPIANTQLYVLDAQREPTPLGVPGELYIGGDGVVRGYYQQAELTDQRFVPDPFREAPGARMYRTGDLARFRDDGVVEFLGRVDFQVKIRGYRIELGEIESFLAASDDVREAVVAAREDVPGDKRLVAYLVAAAGDIDIDRLRARLKEQLPPYMVPQNFVVMKRFPLTPNNKVDRKSLPRPDSMQASTAVDYVAPTGKLSESVAGVWTEVLNVKKVGMDDNFFDLGGHSLLTVQVHRKLKGAGVEVTLTDLFRFPTIRSLVGFLENDGASDTMDKSRDRAAARKDAMSRRAAKLRERRRR